MTKVLAWVKRKYQWEEERFSKAYRVTLYIVMGMLIVFLIIVGVGDYLGAGQTFKTIVCISASGLICFAMGGANAIRWADEQIKKSK